MYDLLLIVQFAAIAAAFICAVCLTISAIAAAQEIAIKREWGVEKFNRMSVAVSIIAYSCCFVYLVAWIAAIIIVIF